jgi:glycine cleavage system aminomethyltransferase T
MAYLPRELSRYGTELQVDVRGRMLDVVVVRRPFVPHAAERVASPPA